MENAQAKKKMAVGKKMFDVITFGSATEDVFMYLHPRAFRGDVCMLHAGSKTEVNDVQVFTGGGATNTAVGFSRLGLKTAIVASIGDDDCGSRILCEMKKEGVNTSLMVTAKKIRTAYSVILTGFGRDRIILVYRGAQARLDDEKKINWKKLNAKWFHISSFHTKPKVLQKIILHGKKMGAKISFNPGGKELALGMKRLEKTLKNVDVLFINREEALKLTGSANINRNLKKLSEHCGIVVITEGKKGAHATDGEWIYMKRALNVEVLDVTGAGDSFNSGFASALAKGRGIETALDWGTANANSVIQSLGTKNVLLNEVGIGKIMKKYGTKKTGVRRKKI